MSDAVPPTASSVDAAGEVSTAKADAKAEKRAERERRREGRGRDWIGSAIGLIVFLGGVALLVLVFRLAYEMFQTPPTVALDVQGGKALDLGKASDRASAIVVKIVLLVVMAAAGSLVANRGILMYARSDGR